MSFNEDNYYKALEDTEKFLKKSIKDNKSNWEKNKNFYLQTKFGEFDITRIQGSFDGALNGLIHHYLYNSGHYKKFLDSKDFKNCEKVIKNDPGSIYQPEDNYELEEKINQFHDQLPNFVKSELESAGFDISDTELAELD
tara:strand:- start:157 stop:576 length:420 start_codon:yes stop_codon:yes gene_type:complete